VLNDTNDVYDQYHRPAYNVDLMAGLGIDFRF